MFIAHLWCLLWAHMLMILYLDSWVLCAFCWLRMWPNLYQHLWGHAHELLWQPLRVQLHDGSNGFRKQKPLESTAWRYVKVTQLVPNSIGNFSLAFRNRELIKGIFSGLLASCCDDKRFKFGERKCQFVNNRSWLSSYKYIIQNENKRIRKSSKERVIQFVFAKYVIISYLPLFHN